MWLLWEGAGARGRGKSEELFSVSVLVSVGLASRGRIWQRWAVQSNAKVSKNGHLAEAGSNRHFVATWLDRIMSPLL